MYKFLCDIKDKTSFERPIGFVAELKKKKKNRQIYIYLSRDDSNADVRLDFCFLFGNRPYQTTGRGNSC